VQQTVFASADFDPEVLEAIKPAKRLSSNSQFDDTSLEELAYVQLSSSNLSKQIKN